MVDEYTLISVTEDLTLLEVLKVLIPSMSSSRIMSVKKYRTPRMQGALIEVEGGGF